MITVSLFESCEGEKEEGEEKPVALSGYKVKANQLIWMTDLTPHESLPRQKAQYHQYFRL